MIEQIKQLAEQYFEEILAIRRHIHANPELSFEEYQTADYVEAQLKKIGIQDVQRMATTGVIAVVKGEKVGETIALRADLDALPICEANDVPYRSKNEGKMHACGHDVHTASLLGAAKILHELKSNLSGAVKLIFQPGEEKSPGGASILVKEGVLENPKPAGIFGQHVFPDMEVGKVGFRSGKYMASADEVYLTIKGKSGHAAMPQKFIDPITIAAQILVALQQVVSRNADPKIPSVLSFGKIQGGIVNNVIPDTVHIAGTFRTFNEEWRKEAIQKIKNIATGIAESFGATCEVEIGEGYPYLENNPELTALAKNAAIDYLGVANVIDMDLRMTSEDFGHYTHHLPGCFYRLGTANKERGITSGVHTETFDIDEKALKIGMGLMAYLAFKRLS